MEVKVITRRGGEYIFTQSNDGKCFLFRHGRTYYHLEGIIRIRKFMPMKFLAHKYYPLLNEFGGTEELRSSMVAKIWIDGLPARKVNIVAGK